MSLPRRLLVVSADIGEGHNATARAVEDHARRRWPGCEIRRVDTLALMGGPVGPAFRWIYRTNVERTPWLYDFFYDALWRHRWFAAASCRVVGAWSGRRLAPVVAEFRPDLIVSTYPLGTGGLDHLRRRGRAPDVPTAAIISDFAPHPFWVYPEIDLHYVASPASLRALHVARPEARGAVGAPPVVPAFRPAEDREGARRRCGFPEDRLVVLISCGSYGFGSVERAVDAALAAGPRVHVVVACGRNEALRSRLGRHAECGRRLVPMGWTDAMPELTAAADVVATNAGGATALEAVACGRPVLLFEPIAGHGRANAALMARAGLAILCPGPAELTTAVASLLDPARLAAAEGRARDHIAGLDLEAELDALPELPRHAGLPRRLRPADALFVATPSTVPQQLGVALMVDGPAPPADRVAAGLTALVARRAPALPMLRRRLERRPGRWPRWSPVDDVEPARHVTSRTVAPREWTAALQETFAAPLPADRPPWRLTVLSDGERTAVLATLHHALGDGLAVTATLMGLLTDRAVPGSAARAPDGRSVGVRRLARGLLSLARTGRVPRAARGGASTADRRVAFVRLPAAEVRAAARERGVGTTALLLAVLAEALHRIDPTRGHVRTLVPRTAAAVRRPGLPGNRTGAMLLDLPVGPMPRARRITEVAAALDRLQRAGQPDAAAAVVAALGALPAPLLTRLVPLVYGGRYCSVIATVLPGFRRVPRVAGLPVAAAYPVVPLTDGVGLAVGFLPWGDTIGVGVTGDAGLSGDPERVAEQVRAAFADLHPPRPPAVDMELSDATTRA
ncbi:MGDG synthase family glycosyltransferase [Pseudonocardia adelaidensis]|uniref:Diacylglycerol O-acyltransferase n=1 Tax=Pseudonocardia adelaidensis TaxID=648754 RepID=A0ABP9NDQ7_9PSEU